MIGGGAAVCSAQPSHDGSPHSGGVACSLHVCNLVFRNTGVSSPVIDIRGSMKNHMTVLPRRRIALAATLILFSAALTPRLHAASQYVQHNLVSDVPGIADQTDPTLVNPWGISMSSTSPFWISNNHTGIAAVYNGQGQPAPAGSPLRVRIPVPSGANSPAAPTGQVFNDTTGFNVAGKPASFIFATEDGTISGWNPSADPANSTVLVDRSASGAVYKGLAIANTSNGPRLYAANFNSAAIDVFDADLSPIASTGAFSDPNLPAGFAPFNIQRIGRKLYVAYAMQDDARHDDTAGPGNGVIDVFDFDGNLVGRLQDAGGATIAIPGLWGLSFGSGCFGYHRKYRDLSTTTDPVGQRTHCSSASALAISVRFSTPAPTALLPISSRTWCQISK
jgi:TIGR03118 family protein